jgi:formate dehydrogenase
VKNPGVKLAPAGITIQELIDEYCGGMQEGTAFYAYLPGRCVGRHPARDHEHDPARLRHPPAYGCFIGSAAVMVLSDQDTAVGAARNLMRFFEHESCGQCTPCRNGTAKASVLMSRPTWDLDLLQDLSVVMRDASICGLGQAAPNPIDCVIRYFPHELAA